MDLIDVIGIIGREIEASTVSKPVKSIAHIVNEICAESKKKNVEIPKKEIHVVDLD